MSGVKRLLSFHLVKQGKSLAPTKSIQDHQFMFDASDLAVMHGDMGYLAEMGGIQGLAASLRTDLKTGLYKDEVEGNFEKRHSFFGRNFFAKPPLKSFWEHCKDALEDPILRLLIVAGLVSIVVGAVENPSKGWVEGLAIILAVVFVTTIGAFNNMQQEKSFRALEESKEEETFKVWRDGKVIRINESDVNVGDVVELAAGDAIPADGIFVAGDDPACNEAKMTGENRDVEKGIHKPFLLAGTELRRGQLIMLATAVGPNSSYGRIMSALAQEIEQTPLQKKLVRLAKLLGKAGAVVAVLVLLLLIIFWLVDVVSNDLSFKSEGHKLISYALICITLIVVSVPEGLPLAVTISLAYSMKEMVKDQNLVRILSACETMGNATCVCSDKTGTLTQNEMSVIKGWLGGVIYDRLIDAPQLDNFIKALLIEGVVVNSKASNEYDPNSKKWVWKGNQTELALLKWLAKYGIDANVEREKFLIIKNYPFDSMKKNSSIIVEVSPQKFRRYYKGAAEQLISKSNRVVSGHEVVEMERSRKEIADLVDSMTKTGLRTIGFAYQDLSEALQRDPTDPLKYMDPPETDSDMVFFGVVGIKDPLRPEARRSVRTAQRAGIIVRMVTGDHPETAKFIASECGIVTNPDHLVMTGDEFRRVMDVPAEAERILPKMRVLARSKPEDKQRLVRWLKEHGEVVAATGDGTNDAPALTEADVGLAMAIVGTAVAKAAAKILILDDNFSSIVKSILWGRAIFDNIRKFIQFQMAINFVALTISLIGVAAGHNNPLKAVQLLWVNLIMDTMAALALGTEYPTMDLLKRRPFKKDALIISKGMWRNILGWGGFQLIILLIILFDGNLIFDVEYKSVKHYTTIFNTFVFMQIFNEINAREVNQGKNPFRGFFRNKIFLSVIAITIFFQYLMVQFFGSFAETEPLNAAQWFICIGFGALMLPYGVLLREVPVTDEGSMIKITEGAFAGAKLDELEEDEKKELAKN